MSRYSSRDAVVQVIKGSIVNDSACTGLPRDPALYNISGIVRDAFHQGSDGWTAELDADVFTTALRQHLRPGAATTAAPEEAPPRPSLTISHSTADGTLLEDSRRGDGAWEAIKAAQKDRKVSGWRWMPSIGMFGLSHSRGHLPKRWIINATADILRDAGFAVEVRIDTAVQPMEEAEKERAARMEDRADRLTERATKHSKAADARDAAEHAIIDGIPFGQPILTDHYSAPRHRRDLARAEGHRVAAREHSKKADHAAAGAASAAVHMAHRENPGVVTRRLERLGADRRKVQRSLDGYTRNSKNGRGVVVHTEVHEPATGGYRERLIEQAAHLDEQIRYWTKHLDEARAAGLIDTVDWSKVKPGDAIKGEFGWEIVKKVNKTTVAVVREPGWNDKMPKHKVTDHRPATPDPQPEPVVDVEPDDAGEEDAPTSPDVIDMDELDALIASCRS